MSREAFGDPPESQEPPDLCPVCGNDWHAEDCELGKEVARRLKAERDAHRLATEERTLRLRYGVVSGWIVQALKVLDTLDPEDSAEADELRKLIAAGEVLALTTLANSKTPAEFECLGEPSLCTNPRGCGCQASSEPHPSCKTPDGCRENGCLGWCDEHKPEVATRCDGCAELRDQLREKAAWCDELERDAERYRFVRTADKVGISAEAARDPVAYDAAIDRAMERAKL